MYWLKWRSNIERLFRTIQSIIVREVEGRNNIVCIGEDVKAGFCGISGNLKEYIGESRVINMPISESCFTSMALGLAMAGQTTIIEYNFSGLVFLTLDQIYNQIFRYSEMTGTELRAPIILLLPTGTKGYRSVHHSDNTYTSLVPLGINCSMPIHKTHVERCLKRAFSKNELHVIYLPMQEFPIEREDCISIEKEDNLAYTLKMKGSKICMLVSGTSLEETSQAIQEITKDTNYSIDIITFYDLNLLHKSSKTLTNLNYEKIIMVDYSIGDYGIYSRLRETSEKMRTSLVIGRTNNTIPFKRSLEIERRSSRDRIISILKEAIEG